MKYNYEMKFSFTSGESAYFHCVDYEIKGNEMICKSVMVNVGILAKSEDVRTEVHIFLDKVQFYYINRFVRLKNGNSVVETFETLKHLEDEEEDKKDDEDAQIKYLYDD